MREVLMKLDIAVLSRAGGRPGNEDACGYWTSEAGCCWVLSDGAGGHGGGDVASKIVVGTIVSEFAASPEASPATVSGLIHRAHAVLQNEQQSAPRLRDMRATVAVLTIDRERRISCRGHVGDSRIYGFRSGHVRFQSRDHSVMQSMIDAGLGDAAMLRRHPQRGVLLAALGSPENVEPDVPPAGEPVR
ncbi:MAG: protein phosphatase 2C domain-containing protein, partial [Proteobacteria bacterium]|nr:protein phosphatase 2C domain-containing protein [Pseudomonadota bacterium]